MSNTIDVGTKLKKFDASDFLLEILELGIPNGELPHARARVSTAGYDCGVRLYSVSALEDGRLFRPVEEAKSIGSS